MLTNKAHWETKGNNVRLSMPIGKVDVERRMVSGFATLDNVDRQGDIVTTESSIEAFKNFRGNLREMHQRNAEAACSPRRIERVHLPHPVIMQDINAPAGGTFA